MESRYPKVHQNLAWPCQPKLGQSISKPYTLILMSHVLNKKYEVASRPTAGRLGDVLSDRQSVV